MVHHPRSCPLSCLPLKQNLHLQNHHLPIPHEDTLTLILTLNLRSPALICSWYHSTLFSLFLSVITAQYLVHLATHPNSLLARFIVPILTVTSGYFSLNILYSCELVSSLFSAVDKTIVLILEPMAASSFTRHLQWFVFANQHTEALLWNNDTLK